MSRPYSERTPRRRALYNLRMPRAPYDLLIDPESGRPDLAETSWDKELERHAKSQANVLNGFGLTANLMFEFTSAVDPESLQPGTVKLFELGPPVTKNFHFSGLSTGGTGVSGVMGPYFLQNSVFCRVAVKASFGYFRLQYLMGTRAFSQRNSLILFLVHPSRASRPAARGGTMRNISEASNGVRHQPSVLA